MSSGTNGSLMTFPYLWKLAKIDFQGFMKRQEDDPQDAKDVFRDKLLTSDNVIPKRRLPANLMISFFI